MSAFGRIMAIMTVRMLPTKLSRRTSVSLLPARKEIAGFRLSALREFLAIMTVPELPSKL